MIPAFVKYERNGISYKKSITIFRYENRLKYIASFSGGKDSLAMVLRLIEENKPLTHIVFFDTEMEYQSIYNNVAKIEAIAETRNIVFKRIKPQDNFYYTMLVKPTSSGYGYKWCGRMCRWRTTNKVKLINEYIKSLNDDYMQYIGIAFDEPKRIKEEENKIYPLVDWCMTEQDCLNYCYSKGYNWLEGKIELYSILDRVSCWCCWNKNLKELRNMKEFLPKYWNDLLGLQSLIKIPFKDNKDLFQLDKEFEEEKKLKERQMRLDL